MLVNQDNSETDETANLSLLSFYNGVINTGGNGIDLTDQSKFLRLYWGKDTLSQIPIIKQQVILKDTNIAIPRIAFVPPHIRGDKDFNGNINISSEAYLEIKDQKSIVLRIYMHATETSSDYTTATGISDIKNEYILYTCSANSTIEIIKSSHYDKLELRPNEDDHSIQNINVKDYISSINAAANIKVFSGYPFRGYAQDILSKTTNNGFVKQWIIVGDRDGDESGIYTSTTPICNDVTIVIKTVK